MPLCVSVWLLVIKKKTTQQWLSKRLALCPLFPPSLLLLINGEVHLGKVTLYIKCFSEQSESIGFRIHLMGSPFKLCSPSPIVQSHSFICTWCELIGEKGWCKSMTVKYGTSPEGEIHSSIIQNMQIVFSVWYSSFSGCYIITCPKCLGQVKISFGQAFWNTKEKELPKHSGTPKIYSCPSWASKKCAFPNTLSYNTTLAILDSLGKETFPSGKCFNWRRIEKIQSSIIQNS